MHFWSEGLGDSELVMSLGHAKAECKGDLIALGGVIDAPAPWEYEVKIQLDDWLAILRIATGGTAVDFIATRARWRQIAKMASSILKFVALLAYYRLRVLLGFGTAVRTTGAPLEHSGVKKA